MDAANLSIKKIAFSLAFALLIPAAAFAQPQFSLSSSSVSLFSGGNPGSETVNSTTSTAITFSATPVSTPTTDHWLCINNGSANAAVTGLVTPATLTLSVCGTPAFNITTHTATVTLADTGGAGATSTTFTVSYNSTSGGTGTSGSQIVASPPQITTGPYATSYSTTVQLSTSSTTPISFSLSENPAVGWLSASANTYQVSSGNPATLSVTLTGSGTYGTLTTTLAVTSASGTLNIPVTFYYGVASSGSSNTGTISVSPTSLSWTYSSSNPSLFPASTQVTPFSTNGGVAYTAVATSSNGWLAVNSVYFTSGTAGVTPITISPTVNLAALATGSYGGTVTITETDDGATTTVQVTANITGANSSQLTISPNPISLSAAVGGATGSTSVTITSAVSGTLNLSTSGSGISLSTYSTFVTAGSPVSLTVFGSPNGLTNGTYVGSLTATVNGNTSNAEITFVVGTGNSGSGTNTTVAPSQLNFYYEQSSSESITQSQQIYLGGSGSFTVTSSTANSSVNWLSSATTSGVLPTTISVTANATGLASGAYTGTISIYNSSTGLTSTVNVTLTVQGITTIYATPGDVVFNYIANASSVSQFQQVTVASSDGSVVAINAAVTNPSATPWLAVSGAGSTPFVALNITTNATGLSNGVYTGSITVTGGNNTVTVPVVLTVAGSSVSGSGTLTLGATALTFTAQVAGSPVTQVLSVSASASTAFSASAQGTYNGITWLTISPVGTSTTPANLSVTANPASLPIGTYAGAITLTSGSGTQTVQVTLVVSTTGTGPTVTVTANNAALPSTGITFMATTVGAAVSPQYINVFSPSGQSSVTFTVSASTTSGGSWLVLGSVVGQQYTTPSQAITVSANDVGLAAGTYTGQITVQPLGGTALSVPVTLVVGGVATIATTTTSLNFSYQAGGATPATQTIPLTVTNASSGAFTATAVSTPSGWLTVTPTSGTAPSSLTVSVNPTSPTVLSAGTYTGTITVAGASGASGSATINVTLTVTVPLPTITSVVNAASFINEAIAPGEIFTIGGTNIGPATPAVFTVATNFGIQTVPSTALGGVQVSVNGYPAPLLYVSSTQINAIVPYEIAGILKPTVLVTFLGQSSNGFSANGAATAPAIFTANGSGTGPGAILNANYSANSASNPAARGTVVQVFMTGEGQTSPAGVDGKVTPSGGPYPAPLLPITITVGGVPANYQFAGEAPGLVSGVLQLNVIIPPASSLTTTGALPLVVSIGSASTQSGVTVNVN